MHRHIAIFKIVVLVMSGIDTIFNVSMHRVSQCIAIIDEFT